MLRVGSLSCPRFCPCSCSNSWSSNSSNSISSLLTWSWAPRFPINELVAKDGSENVDSWVPVWGLPTCWRLRTKWVVRIDARLNINKNSVPYHWKQGLYIHILENWDSACYIRWLKWNILVKWSHLLQKSKWLITLGIYLRDLVHCHSKSKRDWYKPMEGRCQQQTTSQWSYWNGRSDSQSL